LPRYEKKLPIVLSPQEVQALLEAPRKLGHCTMLSTMYAAGPRVSELAHLNVRDIDSARNAIWRPLPPRIRIGKPYCRRSYWSCSAPTGGGSGQKTGLFPGNKPGQPICRPSIFRA
jgi:integrase